MVRQITIKLRLFMVAQTRMRLKINHSDEFNHIVSTHSMQFPFFFFVASQDILIEIKHLNS